MSRFSSSNALLVFALKEESRDHFDDWNPLYTGVGKVNAAYRLTLRLRQWQTERSVLPDLVVNLGSAGSATFPTGTVVNCTAFIQRDFDTTAIGTPSFATPFENTPTSIPGKRLPGFSEGICGTGDAFVTDSVPDSTPIPWNVVDMEAYALAKVCYFEQIPFVSLKYITDGADGQAATSWEEALEHAALALRKALNELTR